MPVVHVKDLTEGSIETVRNLDAVHVEDSKRLDRHLLRCDDILISARGTLMKTAIVPVTHAGTIASANFIVVRLGEKPPIMPRLLSAFLQQPHVHHRILARLTSTAQAALNIRDIETLLVPIPAQELQPKLAHFLAIADEQYQVAVEAARLRKQEAMETLAAYMEYVDAQ